MCTRRNRPGWSDSSVERETFGARPRGMGDEFGGCLGDLWACALEAWQVCRLVKLGNWGSNDIT